MPRLLELDGQSPGFIAASEKIGNNYINAILLIIKHITMTKPKTEFTFTRLYNLFPYWD